ncbi:uncharacterized protein BO80DRAFT_426295 [Aspergillus ibericus CBS 121593]|uniref:Uncharacterized protein n=1 Tax=Aspergillus ibericus CBS 121593 TaxID=1448316 RepID=A0A395GVQ4_9EURO|nr:hypothetical protein BO80DRAFT_426295 [Aspergillus ibericus CBS 121593]RAK99595.1 hypothetical protein BO80DRAFT_426295 [Aspergillus ibericus CBS 121593]
MLASATPNLILLRSSFLAPEGAPLKPRSDGWMKFPRRRAPERRRAGMIPRNASTAIKWVIIMISCLTLALLLLCW